MGTQRGSKTTPQAPALEVRAKGLPPVQVACRARLWNFGPCSDGEPPRHDGTATQLSLLRANVTIDVTENVAIFGPTQENGFRYAKLRCFINRGARVQCRKFHTAFMLDCVYLPPGAPTPGPEESNFAVGPPVENFPWTRSSRMSISEKAMCPRINDRSKKSNSTSPGGGNGDDSSSSSPPQATTAKRMKKTPSSAALMMLHSNSPVSGLDTPVAATKKKELTTAPQQQQGPPPPSALHLAMPNLPSLTGSSAAAQFFNFASTNNTATTGTTTTAPMDRNIRLSTARFSIPGFDDDFFQQHQPGGPGGEDGEFGEGGASGALTSRRTSHFGPSQSNWANFFMYPQVPAPATATNAAVTGASPSTQHHHQGSVSTPTPSSASMSPSSASLFDTEDFRRNIQIQQRRLSPGAGQWSLSPPMNNHSVLQSSDVDGSATPSSLLGKLASHISSTTTAKPAAAVVPPPHTTTATPGLGPEWESLFAAHARMLDASKDDADLQRVLKQDLLRQCEAVILLHGGTV